MSIDCKALLVAVLAASLSVLSACTEPETGGPKQTARVPLPNVDYYLPPAYTTRENTSTVPIGSALCPTLTRFGSPTAFGSATPGCSFR